MLDGERKASWLRLNDTKGSSEKCSQLVGCGIIMISNRVNLVNLHAEKEEKLNFLTVFPAITIFIFQKERPRFSILGILRVLNS